MPRITPVAVTLLAFTFTALGQEAAKAKPELGGALWTPPANLVGESVRGPRPDPNFGTTDYIVWDLAMSGMSNLTDAQWTHGLDSYSRRSAGTNQGICGNVHLPTGAALYGITTYTNDTDAGNDITYELLQWDPVAATAAVPFAFTTTGTPGLEVFFRSISGGPITIDNSQKQYTLCVFHPVTGTSLLTGGAAFWYKLQVSPAPGTPTFTDVDPSNIYYQFIEALAASGVTGGCDVGLYCPDRPITRAEMAVFMAKALGLHFAE